MVRMMEEVTMHQGRLRVHPLPKFHQTVQQAVSKVLLTPCHGNGARQQCTAADRKNMCELQLAHKDLTRGESTALIADQLKLPNIKRSTVTGILK